MGGPDYGEAFSRRLQPTADPDAPASDAVTTGTADVYQPSFPDDTESSAPARPSPRGATAASHRSRADRRSSNPLRSLVPRRFSMPTAKPNRQVGPSEGRGLPQPKQQQEQPGLAEPSSWTVNQGTASKVGGMHGTMRRESIEKHVREMLEQNMREAGSSADTESMVEEQVKQALEEALRPISIDLQDKEVGASCRIGAERLVEVGAPFNPEERNEDTLGIYQRNVPRTVYSAIILEYLCEQNATDGIMVVVRTALLPLALTMVAQLSFAWFLRLGVLDVQGDLADTCFESSFWLRCVALFAFIGLSIGHLFQVVEIHLWLSMFKTSAGYEKLMLQRLHTLDHSQVTRDTDSSNRAVHRPVSGLMKVERVCFYLFLLIPSAFSTMFVMWSGGGALLRAQNDVDLVLNVVAGFFVVELDNYAYTLLLPPTIRNKTENLPPLNLGLKEGNCFRARELVVNYYSWIVSALISAASCCIYAVWCPWGDSASTEVPTALPTIAPTASPM